MNLDMVRAALGRSGQTCWSCSKNMEFCICPKDEDPFRPRPKLCGRRRCAGHCKTCEKLYAVAEVHES